MIQKVTRNEVAELLAGRLKYINFGDDEEFDSGEAVLLSELLSYYYLGQDEKIEVQKSFESFIERYGLQDSLLKT